MRDTIDSFESYMGEEISHRSIRRLIDGPLEHIGVFIEHLAPQYYDWLQHIERSRDGELTTDVLCSVGHRRGVPWRERLKRYRAQLLYFPSLAVPDPVAEVLWPPITVAALLGTVTFPDEAAFRADLEGALLIVADLEPFIRDGNVVLVPHTFAADYSAVQEAVRQELHTLKEESAEQLQIFGEGVLGLVKVDGRICTMCDFTPVAASKFVYDILQYESRAAEARRATVVDYRIADSLLNYQLPNLGSATFRDILALRRDEYAFTNWRRNFADLLATSHEVSEGNPEQFEHEFKVRARDLLTPLVADMEEVTKASPALTRMLLPAALTIGGGFITYRITGSVVPAVGGIVAGGVTSVNWFVDWLVKRWSARGRSKTRLREFFGYLIEETE